MSGLSRKTSLYASVCAISSRYCPREYARKELQRSSLIQMVVLEGRGRRVWTAKPRHSWESHGSYRARHVGSPSFAAYHRAHPWHILIGLDISFTSTTRPLLLPCAQAFPCGTPNLRLDYIFHHAGTSQSKGCLLFVSLPTTSDRLSPTSLPQVGHPLK